MSKNRLVIYASGTANGGGSGFQNLVEASRGGQLDAEIVAVVCNHPTGGVRRRAEKFDINFMYFPAPWTADAYQRIADRFEGDFFALSGWLKLVVGLDPSTRFNSRTVFNIHPGLLPEFGGPGMYGHHVHEAVMQAFRHGQAFYSGPSMHFVIEPKSKEDYDKGPIFFRKWITINPGDTPETLGARVNREEHRYQPAITDLVMRGLISWDGANQRSLALPPDYNVDYFDF